MKVFELAKSCSMSLDSVTVHVNRNNHDYTYNNANDVLLRGIHYDCEVLSWSIESAFHTTRLIINV